MRVEIGGAVLELIEGDISEQETEAVVTAAHWDLGGGQGTDGSIHGKAGPELLEACRHIGGCPIGDAVITPGFRLKTRYVIHAVGPVYESGDAYDQDLLSGAYRNSLQRAAEKGLRSVSIPSISTGAFNYPLEAAAPVAVAAIVEFLETRHHELGLVRLVLYPVEQPHAYRVYAEALSDLLRSRA
jgi:O-acetyl-ADP-ribose deacetylase (regulator of RNase III)